MKYIALFVQEKDVVENTVFSNIPLIDVEFDGRIHPIVIISEP